MNTVPFYEFTSVNWVNFGSFGGLFDVLYQTEQIISKLLLNK